MERLTLQRILKAKMLLIFMLWCGSSFAQNQEQPGSDPVSRAYKACRDNKLDEIKSLRAEGFDVSKQAPIDLGGEINSLLCTAIAFEATEVAEWLIENKAILIYRKNYCSDLNVAANRSPLSLCKLLSNRIKSDSKLSTKTKILMFSDALSMAQESKHPGRTEIVEALTGYIKMLSVKAAK